MKSDIIRSVNGENVVFEYEPDESTEQITVRENQTNEIRAVYKMERVPVYGVDEEICDMRTCAGGTAPSQLTWNVDSYKFETDYDGIKYAAFTDDGSNPMVINFTNSSDRIVIECDVMFSNIVGSDGIFGIMPYSGEQYGIGTGLESDEAGTKWEPMSTELQGYLELEDRQYKNKSAYENRWLHIIMVCADGSMSVTYADRATAAVYTANQKINLGAVGTEAAPINQIVFGRIGGSGSADMGIRRFKAYTVGIPSSVVQEVKNISKGSTTNIAAAHISEVEGVDFDASSLFDATYELQYEDGSIVQADGITISDKGILRVLSSMNADSTQNIYAVVKYSGIIVKKYLLNIT